MVSLHGLETLGFRAKPYTLNPGPTLGFRAEGLGSLCRISFKLSKVWGGRVVVQALGLGFRDLRFRLEGFRA